MLLQAATPPGQNYVLVSTGDPPHSSNFWMGIVGNVFRASLGMVRGPDIVSGNLYSDTAYVDAPLSLIKANKNTPPHKILTECRPEDGSIRLWIDNILYGVGETLTKGPVAGIAWVNATGEVVDTNQPVKFYDNQFVSLGTNRVPPGLPGTMPHFGSNVGVGLPSFRI